MLIRLPKHPKGLIRLALSCLLLATLTPGVATASTKPPTRTSRAGIILNFKHAKIQAVARLVSHMTGEDFILDPRVQGNVTIISTQPISPDAVFATFLSVLQVHGFAAVPAGPHLYKIVPAIEGHEMPGALSSRRPPGDSLITDVVHLRYVDAANLVPDLRSLMGISAQLSAYPATNSLIISDRLNNVERILRIIHEIDRPIGFNIFTLHYASAGTIVRIINKLLSGQAAAGSAPLWIAADERNNSILVRGSPEERLEIKTLINRLDTPVRHGGNTQVIHLHYAEATSLAKILESYVKAAQAERPAAKGHSPRSFQAVVAADKGTNSLIVTAPPRLMRSIRSIIHKLDIRRAQVLVQAIIAELSSNTAAQLGVTWVTDALQSAGSAALTNFSGTGTGIVQLGEAYLGSQAGVSSTTTGVTGVTSPLSSVPDGLLLGVGRIVQNGFSFGALLNALASNTSTNILSTPSILTMDNQKAKIQVGQKIPFETGQYAYGGVTPGSTSSTGIVNPFSTIERHEVGIILQITPRVSARNSVILKIKQKVSTLAPSVAGAIGLITNNRQIETTIVANNRQIVVLGGLISDQISVSKEQVPLLGDIPLLGNLFKYRSTSKQKENLMVFLQPTILKTKSQTSYYTRRSYGLIRSYELAHQKPVPLMPGTRRPTLPAMKYPKTATPAKHSPHSPHRSGDQPS